MLTALRLKLKCFLWWYYVMPLAPFLVCFSWGRAFEQLGNSLMTLAMLVFNFHYASCNALGNLHKISTRPMIQYHKNTNLSRWAT